MTGERPERHEKPELRHHPVLDGRSVQELLRQRVPLVLHQPPEEGEYVRDCDE